MSSVALEGSARGKKLVALFLLNKFLALLTFVSIKLEDLLLETGQGFINRL